MALPDTRRALAGRRRSDRDRKRDQRRRDREAGVPDQHAIDQAILGSLRLMIHGKHGSLRALPKTSELYGLINGAAELLVGSGYDVRAPRARVLWRRTLGERPRTSPVTSSP